MKSNNGNMMVSIEYEWMWGVLLSPVYTCYLVFLSLCVCELVCASPSACLYVTSARARQWVTGWTFVSTENQNIYTCPDVCWVSMFAYRGAAKSTTPLAAGSSLKPQKNLRHFDVAHLSFAPQTLIVLITTQSFKTIWATYLIYILWIHVNTAQAQ